MSSWWTTLAALFVASVLRFYPEHEFIWGRPTIDLGAQGRLVGRRERISLGGSRYDQESYLGVPFARPPLGNFRFRAPVPLPDDPSRIVDANEHGASCMQLIDRPLPWHPIHRSDISEDCLSVNIIRPVLNYTSHDPLPVMVWIYGGGWEDGTSTWYDGRGIVAQGIAIDRPVIFVSLNYRLNAFGFLNSEDLAVRAETKQDVSLNLGYLDQRLALQWVQTHIGKFGGDPTKVTVFGESAGAFSIGAHLSAEKRHPRNLFRAAIMQSGGISGVPLSVPGSYQKSYDLFVERAGCGKDRLQPFDNDPIACLRSLSSDTLLKVVIETKAEAQKMPTIDQLPWWPIQDGDFFGTTPLQALRTGEFAKVPSIIGTNLDEGTMFADVQITSDDELKATIDRAWAMNKSVDISNQVDELLDLYPDIPREGSPFVNPALERASEHDLDHDSRLFEPLDSNQFKRTAALFGDLIFESPRRFQLDAHTGRFSPGTLTGKEAPIWSYHFRQPIPASPKYMGVYHSLDIRFVFAADVNEDSEEGEVARAMSRAWIRFAHDLNPNGPEIPSWAPYDFKTREVLQIRAGNMSIIPDDWRTDGIEFLAHNEELVRATSR